MTQYVYDDRGRLIRETKPDGTILDYGYDEAGNRTRLTTEIIEDTHRLEE